MDSKSYISFCFFSIIVSTSFMACSKDDEPKIIEEVEVNHLVYVSEAEQGDYKNTYSYERVDGKIRLKQVDLFKLGVKKYDLKLRYDDQSRLIECKRSVAISDYYYHENKILNDLLPSDYSIQYSSTQLTVTDNDDLANTRIYSLGSNGFVKEVKWSSEDGAHVMAFERSGNDLVGIDYILGSGSTSSNKTYGFVYDDKKSIDYLRMILPCLYSDHNILRIVITVDGKEISKTSYAYTYRSANYPVVIRKNETVMNNNQEEPYRTSINLKYINADNI
ncbi:hypothetical protein [Ancylomarina sp.]|uniref:hypothetical protein n=1 Tax=Ancylomarina sp. TaxID=1970196 RepID=UPI00356AD443